ncbi:MAG TPA: hypothetical protein VF491_17645 [Vicinamibacterales bacterium]
MRIAPLMRWRQIAPTVHATEHSRLDVLKRHEIALRAETEVHRKHRAIDARIALQYVAVRHLFRSAHHTPKTLDRCLHLDTLPLAPAYERDSIVQWTRATKEHLTCAFRQDEINVHPNGPKTEPL